MAKPRSAVAKRKAGAAMPNIRILLDIDGNPSVDERTFPSVPGAGDIVHINGFEGPVAYRVHRVVFPLGVENVDALIIIRALNHPPDVVPAIPANNVPAASVADQWRAILEQLIKYNNVMMLAGYAGLFAVWQFVRDDIDIFYEGLVAVLTGSSLILFVAFEILGMLSRLFEASSQGDETSKSSKIGHLLDVVYQKSWLVVFVLTVALSFSAAGILMFQVSSHMLFGKSVERSIKPGGNGAA